jgi:nucleotide-binding universal stress UspA family protein
MAGGVATPDEIDAAWSAVKAEATTALDRTVAALSTTVPIDQVVEDGAPGPAICKAAGDCSADVVVVGSRGRGAIRRALLGSVSTHVVNNAPCPVLVVRTGTD